MAVRGFVFAWLKEPPRTASAKAIRDLLRKREAVRAIGVDPVDITMLNRNRVRHLAGLGRSYFNPALKRFSTDKRYAILVCTLQDLSQSITDDILEMLDVLIGRLFKNAEEEMNAEQTKNGRTINSSLLVLRQVATVVRDKNVSDPDVRQITFQAVPEHLVQQAVDHADKTLRPADYNYYDFVARHYSHLRTFLPLVLVALSFTGTAAARSVLDGIAVLTGLGRKKLPADAPVGFVGASWRSVVIQTDGAINPTMWELCLAEAIRETLRSSDLHIVGSRQHRNWMSYLHPPQAWAERRESWFALWDSPRDPESYLNQIATRLDETLRRVTEGWAENDYAHIVDGKLELSKDVGIDTPASAVQLKRAVAALLPPTRLTDLLIEVDAWVGLRSHFTHLHDRDPNASETRGPLHDACLFAVLLAHGCNLSLATMADAADLDYHHLVHTSDWYFREECTRQAIVALVNYHHALPLSAAFGPGTTAMSDGIRFGVAARSLHARHNPRHLGRKRGVTLHDTITDQHQHPYPQIIGIQVREACAVLDAVLHHETELPLQESVTDTHGYTEILFGLFALEQHLFSPRIRDLADQRLYPLDRQQASGELAALFRGPLINRDLIRRCWDDMHRVAASLRDGTVTATLLVGKLHALQRKNGVHRALQELGRLHKTLFILRVISDEQYRRHSGRTLNRGETIHSLARDLFFGQQGIVRERDYEAQLNRATCLSVLINAIIVWNTQYMMKALDHLRATGYPVNDADLTYLSPVLWDHIAFHGSYHFDLATSRHRQGLRPLRGVDEGATRHRRA